MPAKELLFNEEARAQLKTGIDLEGDQKVGAEILKRALEEPVRQLVRNAGLEGSVVVEQLRRENKANWGFNVMTEQYCHLIDAGIIDPAKVIRSALENAASVAGMILTTETLVTELPEKEKKPAAPAGAPDMDY
jgi:chaperonin GroEL